MMRSLNQEVIKKICELIKKVDSMDFNQEILKTLTSFAMNGKLKSTENSLFGNIINEEKLNVIFDNDRLLFAHFYIKTGYREIIAISGIGSNDITVEITKESSKDGCYANVNYSYSKKQYHDRKLVLFETSQSNYDKNSGNSYNETSLTTAYKKGAVKVCEKRYFNYFDSSYIGYFQTDNLIAPNYDNGLEQESSQYYSISNSEYENIIKDLQSLSNSKVLIKKN